MEAIKKTNLRHVAIAIVLGYASKMVLDLNPDVLVDPKTQAPKVHEKATANNIGLAVAALSLYMMSSGRMEGLGGSGSIGSGAQTFYGATENGAF
jgi:hypothetical protein